MMTLSNYIIESSIISVVLFGIFLLFLKNEKSFQFNRFFLLTIPVFSFTMPLVHINEFIYNTNNSFGNFQLDAIYILPKLSTSSQIKIDWFIIITITYSLISFILFFKLLLQFYNLTSYNSKGTKITSDGYNYIKNENQKTVFSFFKNIYLPKNENVNPIIISHEKIHAKEFHSADILFMELLTIFFWFNPIVLLVKKAMNINHEYIADLKVSQKDSQIYIQTLATYHMHFEGLSMASYFGKPSILKRIEMLKQKNTKTMKFKYTTPFVAIFGLFIIFCCEGQQLKNQTNDSLYSNNLDRVYDEVDIPPQPEEGLENYYNWIVNNIKYPEIAKKEGLEGKVLVKFIIDKKGYFTDVEIVKGVHSEIDKEALRVIKSSENWIPGVLEGESVNVRIILPISFKLS